MVVSTCAEITIARKCKRNAREMPNAEMPKFLGLEFLGLGSYSLQASILIVFAQKEDEYRLKTCLFIEYMGKIMRMYIAKPFTVFAFLFVEPYLLLKQLVHMQRFFARHSFKAFDRLLIAGTCMFLAGKVEETPVGLQDISKLYFQAMKEPHPDTQKIAQILVCSLFLYECMYVCMSLCV